LLSRPRGGLQQIGIGDAARAEFAGAADVLGFAEGRASVTDMADAPDEDGSVFKYHFVYCQVLLWTHLRPSIEFSGAIATENARSGPERADMSVGGWE
jgi:hypothetical protein